MNKREVFFIKKMNDITNYEYMAHIYSLFNYQYNIFFKSNKELSVFIYYDVIILIFNDIEIYN